MFNRNRPPTSAMGHLGHAAIAGTLLATTGYMESSVPWFQQQMASKDAAIGAVIFCALLLAVFIASVYRIVRPKPAALPPPDHGRSLGGGVTVGRIQPRPRGGGIRSRV